MALNKLMHPRNIYRDKKPDFKKLAVKYPEFRQHATTDLQGKVHMDFKKPECLRALTWVLLKDDWGLDVDLPLDRLIPTIPLRLNYLLWLEDLLQGQPDITGIDIGTGASCVYPLLGAKKNNWKFLSSETDSYSHKFATKNVEKNELQDSIKVVKVEPSTSLYDLITLEGSEVNYGFCMCNPPFFANNLEAWGVTTTRSDDRSEPRGVDTSSPGESIVPGGEVQFVRQMIEDSTVLKDKVRVYTSMIGKKTSLVPLKDELRKHGITNFGVTEFCQGRTMRWGLGWSYDPTVKFPKPPSKMQRATKPKPPVVYKIPRKMASQQEVQYSVPDIGSKVMTILDGLKVFYEPEKSSPELVEIQMVAVENTWSHQRRKRREKMRALEVLPTKQPRTEGNALISETESKDTTNKESDQNTNSDKILKSDNAESVTECGLTQKPNVDKVSEEAQRALKEEQERLNQSVEDIEEYILKCRLAVKKVEKEIVLEVTWQDGESIELMYQVVQFFKNKLK